MRARMPARSLGVELIEGFEVETQALVLGAAFVGVEDELVGGDAYEEWTDIGRPRS